MDRLKLGGLGERLKVGGAQMSRTISVKMKEILQVQTQEEKLVEEATSDFLEAPNWGLNMRICTLINSGKLSGAEVLRGIKKKFRTKGTMGQWLSLELLEACASNCNKMFSEISSEKVLDEMVRMIDDPLAHHRNKQKALQLIRRWGELDELLCLPVFRQTRLRMKAREKPFVTQKELNMETVIIPKDSGGDILRALPSERHSNHKITLPVQLRKEILMGARDSIERLSSILNSDAEQISDGDDLRLSLMEKCKQTVPTIQKIIESTSDDEDLLCDALSLHDRLERVLS